MDPGGRQRCRIPELSWSSIRKEEKTLLSGYGPEAGRDTRPCGGAREGEARIGAIGAILQS
jgi:hypothetical protein